jgi:hypothetical protein
MAWLTVLTAAACGGDAVTKPPGDAGASGTQAGSPDQAGSPGNSGGAIAAGAAGAGAAGDPGVVPAAGTGGTGLGGSSGSSTGGAGGAGGTGGAGGAGGSVPLGGSPPLLPGTGTGTIGRSCTGPADCSPSLACITAKHRLLGGAAPPHGFCSAPCISDAQCELQGPGALCFPFAEDASYCIEGCSFGTPKLGEPKCHGREDFACNPALLGTTADGCSTTDECLPGELCTDGVCNVVFPGCLPACRGDLDCAPGLYCDQSFMAGTCTPIKPKGKRLGEPCTLPSAQEPAEPDECLGFCQADSDVGNQGHCAATCGLLRECGWDPASQKFDGVCFYASVLTTETGDVGDFGFCTPACNCTEECNDATLACSLLAQGPIDDQQFKGPGLCFAPDASTDELSDCQ